VGSRKVKPIESKMRLLFTQQETQELPIDEINARLIEAFKYDDYAWQRENSVRVKSKRRAEGLHKVLYQCPACNTEYHMSSSKWNISCDSCGKVWEMSEFGELHALTGATEFSHIPDWYEWERMNVRREVEDGVYSLNVQVHIESLPNAKGFIKFSEPGYLTHDTNGFTLAGVFEKEPFALIWPAQSMHSCHIEYNYKGRADCVALNTNDDTFYLFSEARDFAVTKIALATEELYRYSNVSGEASVGKRKLSSVGD